MRKILLIGLCLSLILAIGSNVYARDCTLKAKSNILMIDWAQGGVSMAMSKVDMTITVGDKIDKKLADELNSVESLNIYDWSNASLASVSNGTLESIQSFIVREESICNCVETPDPFPEREERETPESRALKEYNKCKAECLEDHAEGTEEFENCTGACAFGAALEMW